MFLIRRNFFFSYQGTDLEKCQVNKEVIREIRRAKMKYKASVEEKFIKGNIQSAWKGIKAMAGAKKIKNQLELL